MSFKTSAFLLPDDWSLWPPHEAEAADEVMIQLHNWAASPRSRRLNCSSQLSLLLLLSI